MLVVKLQLAACGFNRLAHCYKNPHVFSKHRPYLHLPHSYRPPLEIISHSLKILTLSWIVLKVIYTSTMPRTASDHPEGSDSNELAVLSSGIAPDEESQIGEGLEKNIQTGTQLPDVSGEREPSSRISPDESARLWEDLKTETGFRSYHDYLDTHGERHAHLRLLRHAFKDMTVRTDPYAYSCAIVDVQDRDSACCKLTLRCYSTSGTKILSALRRPPPAATFGIVLWDSTSLDKEMLNALGLGLKIRSHFFNAFLARHPKTPAIIEKDTSWKIADDVVVVGQYVMTLVRNYLSAIPDATPIILIAGLDQSPFSNVHNEPTPAISGVVMGGLTDPVDRLPVWMRDFVRRLESDIKKGKGLGGNDTDLSLNSLTALLQCTMPLFRTECRVTRERYLKVTEPTRTETVETLRKDIFKMRYLLRRMLEDFEDSSLRLRDFIHSPMKQDAPQGQSLMTLEGDLQQVSLEATRLETEIRDYLQLQIGELALQESKKSIELSTSQIEEAKRGQSKVSKTCKITS